MKKITILKTGLTILLFIVLLTKVDLHSIIQTFSSINLLYFVLTLIFIPLLVFTRAYKWKTLLKSVGIDKSTFSLLEVLLIGYFYGLITPGKIGEIGRSYHMPESKVKTLSATVMEKMTDILVLIFLSGLSIMFIFKDFANIIYFLILFVAGLITVIGAAFLFKDNVAIIASRLFKVKKNDTIAFINILKSMMKNGQLMLYTFILTFAYYIMAFISGYMLSQSLGINWVATISIPLIVLLGNIPVTISGLGLRESVGAICFAILGISPQYGVSYSLLIFVVNTLTPGVIGYILVMKTKNSRINNVDDTLNKGQVTGIMSPLLEKWRMSIISKHVTGHKILDYGCGYGKLSTQMPEKEYVGFDIDQDVLITAKKIYTNKNVSFATLDDIKDKGLTFDTIILSAVLEHLEDPEMTLRHLKPLLTNDGKIIITTPTLMANKILGQGSKIRLFSREAVEEHKYILGKKDFFELSEKTGMSLELYTNFEMGMNQLVIYKNN